MVDILKLIKSPLDDERWIGKVVIGGVIFYIPVLQFFAYGYIINLIRAEIAGGDRNLPEWTNWGKMFAEGILYWVAVFAYMLIPRLIFGIGLSLPRLSPLVPFVLPFSFFLATVAALGALFILPMALCHFAAKGNFRNAFDFAGIYERIRNAGREYAIAYLLRLGLFLGAYIACLLLASIYIGVLIWPFAAFYLHIITARMFAGIYAGRGKEPSSPEPAAAEPAR